MHGSSSARLSPGKVAVLAMATALLSCNYAEYFGDNCHAPKYVAEMAPDWAPCGCPNFEGDTDKWQGACPLETHLCVFHDEGGTCTPRCEVDADCPAHSSGLPAACGYNAHCVLPCDDERVCPDGFTCLDGFGCLHDFADD